MQDKVNQRERQRCKTKKSIDQHQQYKTRVQDKGARQGFKRTEHGIGFEGTRKRRSKTVVQDK